MERGQKVKVINPTLIYYGYTGIIEIVGAKPIINKNEQLFKVKLPEGSFWYMRDELEEVD